MLSSQIISIYLDANCIMPKTSTLPFRSILNASTNEERQYSSFGNINSTSNSKMFWEIIDSSSKQLCFIYNKTTTIRTLLSSVCYSQFDSRHDIVIAPHRCSTGDGGKRKLNLNKKKKIKEKNELTHTQNRKQRTRLSCWLFVVA